MFIVGGNQTAGGYDVDNSLRFNDGSSDYLSQTFGTPTNNRKYTLSTWIKRGSNLGSRTAIFGAGSGGSNENYIGFNTDNTFYYYIFNGSQYRYVSSAVYRDVSAWYHCVVAVDTTLADADDRVILYINGERVAIGTQEDIPQNFDSRINSAVNHGVGYSGNTSFAYYWDGYQAETVFIDGQQLDPTSFGEFDEDSGIWKPINVSGLSFGNNGFYLEYKDSSALGDDTSGNSNDFTVNNLTSIDQTTDTCTNNFATYNPLQPASTSGSNTFSNGNCTVTTPTSGGHAPISNFAIPKSGKWYWEVRIDTTGGSINDNLRIGMQVWDKDNLTNPTLGDIRYISNATKNVDGSNSSYGATYGSNGDIIGVAVDSDGNTVEFFKNGSSQGSISYTQNSSDYFAVTAEASNSVTATYSFNFGNPPFSISSGNSDGNGYGNFEYSVPSGYYALNTKNLAEYG